MNKQLAKLLFIIEGRNPGVVMLHAELHQGSIAGGQMLALLCFLNLLLSLFWGKGNAGEMGRDASTICLSNHGSLTIL